MEKDLCELDEITFGIYSAEEIKNMSLRYYPLSKIKSNKSTNGIEFLLNGNAYSGKY